MAMLATLSNMIFLADGNGAMNGALRGALIGACVGGVVGLIMALVKKKPKQ